jgi:hypothetical protein
VLRRVNVLFLFLALAVAPVWADDDPSAASEEMGGEIVDRYLTAIETQKNNPRPLSMEIEIDGAIPRLKKQGRLHALRFITRVGQIVYDALRYEGDNTVKKELIARYLEAEKKARSDYSGSLSITPANYKFKYKGATDYVGRTAHVFQLQPRKKRVGLFKGELWVDAETYLPLREWGELVRNPSVFLKNVYFVRDYHIQDGISVPRRIISNVDTRIVGRANLTIWFDRYDTTSAPAVAANGSATVLPAAYGN